jgi:hypothetical protein
MAISAIFISLYLLIAAFIAIAFCIRAWKKYQKTEELFIKTADLRSVNKQIKECEDSLKQHNDDFDAI